jgi:hypothetical protein
MAALDDRRRRHHRRGDRHDRYRVANSRRRFRDPHPRSTVRNLVVLPCRANGDAVTQAYCDGLTDTLSAKLTPLAVARGLQLTSTVEVRGRASTTPPRPAASSAPR